MTGRDENVIILFRGGRLPEWHQLDEARRSDYERRHVDLMLSVADRHGLIGIHGYRLVGPRGSWERFWTIEFPDLAGAEAWMTAEAEPPYGRYGYYDYTLARRWRPECLNWLPRKAEPQVPNIPGTDPQRSFRPFRPILRRSSCWPSAAGTGARNRTRPGICEIPGSTTKRDGGACGR